jgi:aryl-phospho-beta-D-glucosidase BglC (GH1 family)
MIQPDTFTPECPSLLAGEWGANHIRWQLIWGGFPNSPADTATVEEYAAWMERQMEQLDRMVPYLERYGVRIALDVHTPPGGRFPRLEGAAMRRFQYKQYQDAFVETWRTLATRYRDVDVIWAYDILNEAVEGNMPTIGDTTQIEGLLNWRALALKTSKVIREIDPYTAIIMHPEPWGSPEALAWLEPFCPTEVPNVLYTVHMYLPHAFTHQGVWETPMGLVYPGVMPDGIYWDKEQIRRSLQVVRDFAADYGVHIYIGEFGSIRWAPDNSSYRWLRDVIEVFEEEGWDWAYHAFREWHGWSVEHSTDRDDNRRTTEPTDRELLLRYWFGKNER